MNTPMPTTNAARPSTVKAVSLRCVGQNPTMSTKIATARPMLAFLKNFFISSDKMFLQDINRQQGQCQPTTEYPPVTGHCSSRFRGRPEARAPIPAMKLPTTTPAPIDVASSSNAPVCGPASAKWCDMAETLSCAAAHVARRMCRKADWGLSEERVGRRWDGSPQSRGLRSHPRAATASVAAGLIASAPAADSAGELGSI